MIRPDFRYYRNDRSNLTLQHSAKGSVWERHKYIKKENGVYYYPNNYKGGRHLLDDIKEKAENAVNDIKKTGRTALEDAGIIKPKNPVKRAFNSVRNTLEDKGVIETKSPIRKTRRIIDKAVDSGKSTFDKFIKGFTGSSKKKETVTSSRTYGREPIRLIEEKGIPDWYKPYASGKRKKKFKLPWL